MLQDKDKKILDVLREDSRLSIRDIAKKTSLRPSTVHDRITKLKKDNVIEKSKSSKGLSKFIRNKFF